MTKNNTSAPSGEHDTEIKDHSTSPDNDANQESPHTPAKINGCIEVKYCPHCGAHPIRAVRGNDTSDICIDCRNCGKFIWVRSHPPDDCAINMISDTESQKRNSHAE